MLAGCDIYVMVFVLEHSRAFRLGRPSIPMLPVRMTEFSNLSPSLKSLPVQIGAVLWPGGAGMRMGKDMRNRNQHNTCIPIGDAKREPAVIPPHCTRPNNRNCHRRHRQDYRESRRREYFTLSCKRFRLPVSVICECGGKSAQHEIPL